MKLKVLSANMWLMPFLLSVDHKKRVDLLVDIINKEEPEIVLLQEVWMNRWVNYLHKRLNRKYKTLLHNHRVVNRTGLLCLSKLDNLSLKFNKFKVNSGYNLFERIANKGFISFIVKKQGTKIMIVNTHLYDPMNGRGKIINRSQLDHVTDYITDTSFPVIIGGDFNNSLDKIRRGKDYTISECPNKIDNIHNDYRQKGLNNFRFNEHDQSRIVVHAKTRIRISARCIVTPLVSDHLPVVAEIVL